MFLSYMLRKIILMFTQELRLCVICGISVDGHLRLIIFARLILKLGTLLLLHLRGFSLLYCRQNNRNDLLRCQCTTRGVGAFNDNFINAFNGIRNDNILGPRHGAFRTWNESGVLCVENAREMGPCDAQLSALLSLNMRDAVCISGMKCLCLQCSIILDNNGNRIFNIHDVSIPITNVPTSRGYQWSHILLIIAVHIWFRCLYDIW